MNPSDKAELLGTLIMCSPILALYLSQEWDTIKARHQMRRMRKTRRL